MKDLLALVKNYLNQKDTDFAILINGQWGSGKTYFWKNSVIEEIEKTEYGKDKEGKPVMYEPIYVSLFGVSSLSEMLSKLSLELLPLKIKTIASSKAARITGFLLKSVVSRAGNFFRVGGVGPEEEKAFLEAITNFTPNKVLCFDDLERINPDAINDILGYINQFVEHDKMKVILLADEKELLKTGNELYPKVKEKLIRFTFQFNPAIKEILPNFLSSHGDEGFATFISKHEGVIVAAFHNGEHKNLRTLKFILDLFKSVYDEVKVSKTIKKEDMDGILSRLLLFTVCYSIEYKKRNKEEFLDKIREIRSDILPSREMLDNLLAPDTYSEKVEVKKTEAEVFVENFEKNYLHFEGYDFFQFFPSIRDFIHSGYLEKEKFEAEIKYLQEEFDKDKISEEQQLLKQFNYGAYLEDEEYERVLKQIVDKAKKGDFLLQSYPQIVTNLLLVERDGLYEFKLDEELMEQIQEGMRISQKKSSFNPYFTPFSQDIEHAEKRLKKVVTYTIELNDALNDNSLEKFALGLLKAIAENDGPKIHEILTAGENMQYPFLQYLSAEQVLDALIASTNKTKLYFQQALQLRYRSKYIPHHLILEANFVKVFNAGLIEYLAKQKSKKMSTGQFEAIQKDTAMFVKNTV